MSAMCYKCGKKAGDIPVAGVKYKSVNHALQTVIDEVDIDRDGTVRSLELNGVCGVVVTGDRCVCRRDTCDLCTQILVIFAAFLE